MKNFFAASILATSVLCLTACKSGGSGTTNSGPFAFQSTSITATDFVNALNSATTDPQESFLERDIHETLRSRIAGQDDWFLIWDAQFSEYKAVSLQFLRSIVYYDYAMNHSHTAAEFRAIERNFIFTGEDNGDPDGQYYEVVDYHVSGGTFTGRNSGFQYEDQAATTDVSLLTAEQEQVEFFKKAARISLAFNLGIETSLSLVSLSEKTETLLGNRGGELTSADQAAFAADLPRLTGVSLPEVVKASSNEQDRKALLSKIAEKIGTSAANLEGKVLPALFGSQL